MLHAPKRITLIASLLLIALLLASLGYWRFGRAVEVVGVPVKQGTIAQYVTGPGTVQARSAVTLASRLTATVSDVQADVGDTVQAGQLLVVLDDREANARLGAVRSQQKALASTIEAARAGLARAEAEQALAQSRQRRDADLRAQGFLSAAALDASAAGLQVAASGVSSARATLAAREADAGTLMQEARALETAASHTRLMAPMTGLVVQRLAEPGSTVGVGSPLLKLVDPNSLWVATRVDESVLDRVAIGQNAQIRLRSGEEVSGQVARIARQSDAATRELDVFVRFEQMPRHFAIDQEAAVTIETGQSAGWVVPLSALAKDRDGRTGVFVVQEGQAVFRQVNTDGAQADLVRVSNGLTEGDVVVRDSQGVRDRQRVRLIAAT
jgi:HlyD family secretion protein